MNSEMPLASVVCFTYNHEKYIRQALDGFIIQRCSFPIEIIVHDDASMDDTANIIREYSIKYPLIKAILQQENQYSKNKHFFEHIYTKETNGKYIAVCEGDDYWTDPLKLQKQIIFLEANLDYGMCYTRARCYIQKKNKFGGYRGLPFGTFDTLLLYNVIPTLTVVMRKDLLVKYYSEIKPQEQKWLLGDWPKWLWMAKNSKIKYENCVTSVYRKLPESASSSENLEKMEKFFRSCINIKEYFIKQYGVENGDTLEEIIFQKIWAIFSFACLFNKSELFDEVRKDIERVQKMHLRLLYMKLVMFCRPMRYLLVVFRKIKKY